MKFIPPEEWQPQGISELEPNAWRALRERASTSVIAGPGAGKTEFLAQKAAYLLETGICPINQQILAISFKTDAAKNLAERVNERCPKELSNRFESMTFDAFTKNIVDRFRMALPEDWRPTKPYNIGFSNKRGVFSFINQFEKKYWHNQGTINLTNQLKSQWSSFESEFIGSQRLGDSNTGWLEQQCFDNWLSNQIHRGESTASTLTFMAINRLAEYIIRTNAHIRRGLKATYPFIFIDEFQDTTFGQYDFLLSAFRHNRTTITVVGDYKQRIMGWAGARGDAFHQFESDFSAQKHPLVLNHRSSPELVRIQHVVASAIDHEVREVRTNNLSQIGDEAAWICRCPSIIQEANYFSQWIWTDMQKRSLQPRDYVILVRQLPDNYEEPLLTHLAGHGLSMRNESIKLGSTTLQDLLTEELTVLFSNLLRLGLNLRNAKVWSKVSADIQLLRNVNDDSQRRLRVVERQLLSFISCLKDLMNEPFCIDTVRVAFEMVISFINAGDLRKTYSRYSTGDLLDIMLEALSIYFEQCVMSSNSWQSCVDEFEGVNHIPLMTIHKSKGLEFDTMIFLGLDDKAWWTHHPGNSEGVSTFFVALSRAKQRAIFSFCDERGGRERVSDLYFLLASAGVREYNV